MLHFIRNVIFFSKLWPHTLSNSVKAMKTSMENVCLFTCLFKMYMYFS